MKNSGKNKKLAIIANTVIEKFKDMNIPLEKSVENKSFLSLFSPVLVSVVNYQILIGINLKQDIISINIQYKDQIDDDYKFTIIEFANRYNKLYANVGFAVVEPETNILQFKAGVELLPGKLDTNHLETCFDTACGNAATVFSFIESTKESGLNAGELILRFSGYNTGNSTDHQTRMN